ncbi:hypothetical protein KOW79_005446 [Hemibagrus wyckioides]|uniref:Uncharacterized protein n=1 Tax=Hemibagrus wyckioides TaxID=337641 RepID=A0A9D3SPA1_9TELE|nr:hypothetical protein KOW79_005446 [Hemibagrus wyckioides]
MAVPVNRLNGYIPSAFGRYSGDVAPTLITWLFRAYMPAEISQQGPTLTELHAEDKERESRLNKDDFQFPSQAS